jgi:hypothetical protein
MLLGWLKFHTLSCDPHPTHNISVSFPTFYVFMIAFQILWRSLEYSSWGSSLASIPHFPQYLTQISFSQYRPFMTISHPEGESDWGWWRWKCDYEYRVTRNIVSKGTVRTQAKLTKNPRDFLWVAWQWTRTVSCFSPCGRICQCSQMLGSWHSSWHPHRKCLFFLFKYTLFLSLWEGKSVHYGSSFGAQTLSVGTWLYVLHENRHCAFTDLNQGVPVGMSDSFTWCQDKQKPRVERLLQS